MQWQDYDTGAPITAQMVAEKIDIGSMGDYPLLINGSKTQANERARTEFVSVTGYSPTGSLNMVVVPPNSPIRSIADLKGKKVSASVGSAGHGTLVRALDNAGIDPKTGVEVLNQQPQVGASALESGQAQALSQFVAWPGLLVFQNKAKLLYDGAEGDYPTFHGVVVRRDYAGQHPEVLDAFLQAQLDATEFLNQNPLESAKLVADGSGLPQEVVYLYNGPGGTSFDTTLKPSLIEAFKGDVPYLKSIGDFADLDIDGFVDDTAIRKAFADRGQDYDAALKSTRQPVRDPRPGPGLQRRGHRSQTGRRTLDRRQGRDPTRRQPRLPAARRPRGQRPRRAGPRRLRPRHRVRHPLVRRQVHLGAGRPQLPAVRHARRRPALHRQPTPARRSSTTSRR